MTIKTDDGKEFTYSIATNPDTSGYGIGTCPIIEKIDSDLKTIRKSNIIEKNLTKKELKDMSCCNLGIDNLVGKYYDKDGFIYFCNGDVIYRFPLKIKYFAKIRRTNESL